MTNGIKVGDQVLIPGIPPIIGEVVEIDDHPMEYAQLKIECLGGLGKFTVWASARMAKKA